MTTINFSLWDMFCAYKHADARMSRVLMYDLDCSKTQRKSLIEQYEGHFIGAMAEMAVARYLGLSEMLRHDSFSKQSDLPYNIGVRSTPYSTGHLILTNNDPDHERHVLVVVAPFVTHIKGWIETKQGKHTTFWREDKNSFWVPQHKLKPMEELKCLIQKAAMNGQPLNGSLTTTTPDFPSF